MILNYENLDVWNKAISLADRIYDVTESFPKQEMFGLSSQLRRAAVSIASNIAEGSARGGRNEFAHFTSIARGSLAELQTQLVIAHKRRFIENMLFDELKQETVLLSKMLMGLLRALKQPAKHKAQSTEHTTP